MHSPEKPLPVEAEPVLTAAGTGHRKPNVTMMAIGSPSDPRTWSGTPHFAMRQLQRHFPVDVIETQRTDYLVNRSARLVRSLGWDPLREGVVHEIYRRVAMPQLRRTPPDLLFGVICSHKMLRLPPEFPIILMADALYGTVAGYYGNRVGQNERTLRLGNRLQQQMIDRVSTIMLTSQWAADDARTHYRIHETTKLMVAPIGPNIVGDPAAPDDGSPVADPAATPDGPPRLLFVGFDWERKGGPDVLALHAMLRTEFPDLRLDIVGCRPPETEGLAGVTAHGVLRKSVPQELRLLKSLYRGASLFTMLSQQEAYGVVYAEAAAFGLPSIARNTGGVATLVQDGVNGFVFDIGAPVAEIARRVSALLNAPVDYGAMRARSRRLYESCLNWDAWGDTAAAEVASAIRAWPEKARWLKSVMA